MYHMTYIYGIMWLICDVIWLSAIVQVVGIELLGYRKRLQYGISELRRTHPQWAELNSRNTSGQPSTKLSGVPKIPAKKRKATPTVPIGPTHAQLLREDGSKLVVRSPSEAMLASGSGSGSVGSVASTTGAGRIARVASETWKHPNSALTEGCNYHIKVHVHVHILTWKWCVYIYIPQRLHAASLVGQE